MYPDGMVRHAQDSCVVFWIQETGCVLLVQLWAVRSVPSVSAHRPVSFRASHPPFHIPALSVSVHR